MSVKDIRFGAECPICSDYLPGSDDARMVWAGVAQAAKAGCVGNCDLCGESCNSLEHTKEIAARGLPDTGLALSAEDMKVWL